MTALARSALNSPYFTWLVLFLPAPALLLDLVEQNRYYAEIMYESGLLATQLMILALAITPLMRLSRRWKPGQQPLRWLQRRRRYIGVASFGYSALHAIFYIRHTGDLELVLLELEDWSLATGWICFFLLAALAATSNDWSMRRLGRWWKRLQTAAYLAAAVTALHWWLIGQFIDQMWVWFVPLLVLQVLRLFSGAKNRPVNRDFSRAQL